MRWVRDPAEVARKIEAFLAAEAHVRVVEQDRVPLTLAPQHAGFSVLVEQGKTVLHLWSAEASLLRRVVELREERRALHLSALRLGQNRPAPLRLEATSARADRWPQRHVFRQRLLAAIETVWRPWRVAPAQVRAPRSQAELLLLHSRFGHCLCAAVRESTSGGESVLADLLLWSRRLREAGEIEAGHSFRLVVPSSAAALQQLRIAGLRAAARISVFVWDEERGLRPPPPWDWGNLQSRLRSPAGLPLEPPAAWQEASELITRECPAAERAQDADGRWCFRLHGLTFLRQTAGTEAWQAPLAFADFASGDGRRGRFRPLLPGTEAAFLSSLRRLARERDASGDPSAPLFQLQPEAWLEEMVRRNLPQLDPLCDGRFLYRQVPSFSQPGRDVIDLLAARRDGRLCIFELKASEAASLPLQALDYWQRVRRHLAAGDFTRHGYFPGLELSPAPPVLVLVTPALRRHSGFSELLAELTPEIPIVVLSLNERWRTELRVVERQTTEASARGDTVSAL